MPLTQTPFGIAGQILVRTAGDPASFGNVLRNTVHAVDPNQPVENVQTLDDLRSEALAAPRLTATLLGVFAALALLVTLAGIGGVIATSVQQRTKEFGLRMALGARRDSVLMMVVRQGLTLVVIGLVIGVVGALAAGRVLSSYLYQTAPRDPLIIAGVAAGVRARGRARVPDPGAPRHHGRSADRAESGVTEIGSDEVRSRRIAISEFSALQFLPFNSVELFDRRGRRLAGLLQTRRHFLGLPHHPQHVQSKDLLDVVVLVAALQQLRGERGIGRDVLESDDDAA